jgi:toxin ParE1/3/4
MRPVVWSADAHRDDLEILRYIAQSNPAAAQRVVDAIEKAGNALGSFATGRPGRVTGTYEKSVARVPDIIAYSLSVQGGREVVSILRVIHMASDWPAEEWPQ